jgi:hypothetical protein
MEAGRDDSLLWRKLGTIANNELGGGRIILGSLAET